jgi:hypothetical protein
LQPGLQRIEHLGGIGQPGFPFGRQAQAAGRTRKRRILSVVSRRLIAALTCAGCCPTSRAASLNCPAPPRGQIASDLPV